MPEIITRVEAMARGLRFCFTGEPCGKGHVAQRYVADGRTGRCVECYPLKVPAPRKHKSAKPKIKPSPKVEAAPATAEPERPLFHRDPGRWCDPQKIDAAIERIFNGAPRLGVATLAASEAA